MTLSDWSYFFIYGNVQGGDDYDVLVIIIVWGFFFHTIAEPNRPMTG